MEEKYELVLVGLQPSAQNAIETESESAGYRHATYAVWQSPASRYACMRRRAPIDFHFIHLKNRRIDHRRHRFDTNE